MLASLPGKAVGAAGDAVGVTAGAVDWAAARTVDAAGVSFATFAGRATASLDQLRAMFAACVTQFPPVQAFRFVSAVADALDEGDCTPARVEPPRVHGHVAVLVGGLGSKGDATTKEGAAIFGLDTGALGYGANDVHRFSYRGGTTDENPYGKDDTEVDIRTSGARLRTLLERLQYDHPGLTVDIFAHSQGGLVTRAALADGYSRSDPRFPQIGAIVTMGSPHQGTDGATAAAMLRRNPVTDLELRGVHVALPSQDDPRATSIAQMSEDSEFIAWLNRRALPDDVWVTSIGGREDWLVPATQTHLAGAHNVTLSVPGPTTHDALPKSAAARREAQLAINHMPPTCQDLLTRVANTVVPVGVHQAEQGLGRTLVGGGGLP
jgi:hypothetical protein